MPTGPGVVAESTIREVADWAPPGVASFLLTSMVDPEAIAQQHRRCRTQVIQLCDALAVEALVELRASLPGTRLVQVIHVTGAESVDEAREVAAHVDAILLDSGRPGAAVKELGGTGRTHDWVQSARIVDRVGVPVYLAGGLNAENVGEAIQRVRPFGVDLCTGVRVDGKLHQSHLFQFMGAVRAAERA